MRVAISPWAITFAVLAAVVALSPGLLDAGPIGWATFSTGASESFTGFAGESIPLVFGAGLVSAAWHLGGAVERLAASGVALYGASHGEEFQSLIGAGGGGGLITDVVIPTIQSVPTVLLF